ncbi:MAG: hypothetical protein ABR879_07245 [Methanomassiliicoccales archaeon]|jgi:hypothetical protein
MANAARVNDERRQTGCVGTYRRRTIGIDCQGCKGRQDLTDRSCMIGTLRLLARHQSAERIELLGTWEVRYDRDVVSVLSPLARILRALEAVQSATPEGRVCRQCDASPSDVISRILSKFPARPAAEDLGLIIPKSRDMECESCVERTRSAMAAAGRELGKFESSLTKRAFKVVGGESDASDSSQGPIVQIKRS